MITFYNQVLHIVHVLMTKNQQFCMCFQLFNTICNVKDRQATKHKVIFPLSILITQIYSSWMHVDQYNDVFYEEL